LSRPTCAPAIRIQFSCGANFTGIWVIPTDLFLTACSGEPKITFDMRFEKKNLRVELRHRLQKLSAIQREQFSSQARARLQKQAVWQIAKSILFYAPLADELNLWPLVADALAEKKIVVLPQFNSKTNHY